MADKAPTKPHTTTQAILEGGKRYSAGELIQLTVERGKSLGDVVTSGAPKAAKPEAAKENPAEEKAEE